MRKEILKTKDHSLEKEWNPLLSCFIVIVYLATKKYNYWFDLQATVFAAQYTFINICNSLNVPYLSYGITAATSKLTVYYNKGSTSIILECCSGRESNPSLPQGRLALEIINETEAYNNFASGYNYFISKKCYFYQN